MKLSVSTVYDVGTLLDEFTDFDLVYDTYFKVAAEEISYRGNNITVGDAIKDTYMSAACIASRGTNSFFGRVSFICTGDT